MWFIKASLTCYILLRFGNPESNKNQRHDTEKGCRYPHLERLCLELQCFIYNLTIASLFNNSACFDPCFPRQSITSAVTYKRLILIFIAQFLARHLRVKITHKRCVRWQLNAFFPSETEQIQVKIFPATNEYDLMQRGFWRPSQNKVKSTRAAFTLSPSPRSYLKYNFRYLCCHHTVYKILENTWK